MKNVVNKVFSAYPVHSYEGRIEHLQVTSNTLFSVESSVNRGILGQI